MCGIHLMLCDVSKYIFGQEKYVCQSRVKNRGPDAHSTICRALNDRIQAVFSGFTLHFQGQVTPQPLCSIDSCPNILLWNGEVFSGIETGDTNDGLVILGLLNNCKSNADILTVLSKVHGPWGFVFWQESHNKLWFGRDVFGRRSLLYHFSNEESPCFVLSSVATEDHPSWKEVPARGIYVIDFSTQKLEKDTEVVLFPWVVDKLINSDSDLVQEIKDSTKLFHQTSGNVIDIWQDINLVQSSLGIRVPFNAFNDSTSDVNILKGSSENVPIEDFPSLRELATDEQLVLSEELIDVLSKAVRLRVENQSSLCHNCITSALSTGSDSSEEKRKSSLPDTEPASNSKESGEPIDSGESSNISEKLQGFSLNSPEAEEYGTQDRYDNTCGDVAGSTEILACGHTSIPSSSTEPELGITVPTLLSTTTRCGHARVGILYSGGIDSLVLAALADRFVPADEPIDLLNVAFEQKKLEGTKPKKHGAKAKSNSAEVTNFEVPDRATGRDGIKQLNPSRMWNFVEINISVRELQEARAEHVKKLVYPLNTVLDDSIGCAIWFAARGQGIINQGETAIPYTTSARNCEDIHTRPLTMGSQKTKYYEASSKKRQRMEQKLLEACMKRDVKRVERLLSLGVPADVRMERDGEGQCKTALMHLAYSRNYCYRTEYGSALEDITRLLLQHGASLNVTDAKGLYAIHHIVRNNFLNLLKIIIDYGAELNIKACTNLRQFPIHEANNPAVIQLLVHSGASVNSMDTKGYTPLHTTLLVRNPNLDKLHALLSSGANPNLKSRHGKAPLHYLYHSYSDAKRSLPPYGEDKLLIHFGANPNLKDPHGIVPFAYFIYKAKPFDLLCSLRLNIAAGLDIRAIALYMRPIEKAMCRMKNYKLMEIIVQCGHLFRNGSVIWRVASENYTLAGILCDMEQISSLKRLAANLLRTSLQPNALIGIKMLDLPHVLQDFILFQHV